MAASTSTTNPTFWTNSWPTNMAVGDAPINWTRPRCRSSNRRPWSIQTSTRSRSRSAEHQPARASEQGTSDAGPECLLPNEVAVIRLVGAILANTTMAAGNTAEEVDKLRRGGDGHIVVWGGVSFWRSLMRLDLIDEFRQDLYPHVAGEDTGLFDDVPKSYRLDLVSSTAFSNGTVGLHYRRHR